MFIVRDRPVNIGGKTVYPGLGEASIIQASLESEMTPDARRACVRVADEAFAEDTIKPALAAYYAKPAYAATATDKIAPEAK